MDLIKSAAIMLDGHIWTGRRHDLIITQMGEETGLRPIRGLQGFVTDSGRFVEREEASVIACLSGQVKKLRKPGMLFSEELLW